MKAIFSMEAAYKKTSKLRVTGLCVENSPGTGEFPAQMARNAENGSIWWRHHVLNAPSLSVLIELAQWQDLANTAANNVMATYSPKLIF